MKTDIHPTYFPQAIVTCACGNTFTVGSTREKISVEICSECHPFYTGNEKILDTAGRVEKFKRRSAFAKDAAEKSAFAKAQAGKRAAGRAKAEPHKRPSAPKAKKNS